MADIFVAYAHEDESKARLVAKMLAQYGWSVFWDKDLAAGTTWANRLEQELQQAKCVIVLWSITSTKNRNVFAEANFAAERNVLVPIAIEEGVEVSVYLRPIQTFKWLGESSPPQFDRLLDRLEKLAGPPNRNLDCPGCRHQVIFHRRDRYCPECGCALLTVLCPVCGTEQITAGGLEEGDVRPCQYCTSLLVVVSVEPLELEPVVDEPGVSCPACGEDIEVDEDDLGEGDSVTCELRRSREMTLLCSPRMTTTTPNWWRFCPQARAHSCHTANPVRAKAPAPPHVSALPAQIAWSRKLNALRAPSARMTENHPARLRRG